MFGMKNIPQRNPVRNCTSDDFENINFDEKTLAGQVV
jgi:hypothetical protein